MMLVDFMDKYHLSCIDVAKMIGVSTTRVWYLRKGGCHKAMEKYAPIIESKTPNCKDKIYIPTEEESSGRYKRVQKIPFTSEELEIAKKNIYRIPYRTVKKMFSGGMFSPRIHDKIMATLKGEADTRFCEMLLYGGENGDSKGV